ncbi:MAG: IS21-like element helper ATPase IstB [Myxococcales bacterium]|nr:IS21-like element helper ATPase IstB [Myxococcales bacterium]
MTANPHKTLALHLRALKLPAFNLHWEEVASSAEKQGWSFGQFLHHLAELEMERRRTRRIERFLHGSNLPATKTLGTLDLEKLPDKVRKALPRLCGGGFVDRGDNLLVFGLPGRGKTHVVCAIGHELVRSGRQVYFASTNLLVQRLLAAKRDLQLERELKRLDRFDAVILDDLGYVQQDRAEMEVLFTLLAERYERKSVIITSNLVFSQWDQIFKDPMTTAAAIDRVVHHSVILEMTNESIRENEAKARQKGDLG